MLVSSSTSSFLGSGVVHVSTNTGSAKTTQSDTSNQAEASDSFILNMNITESESSTDEQIARKLEQMKRIQQQAESKATAVKLEKMPERKVEEPKQEETPAEEPVSKTSEEVPPPKEQPSQPDLSFDYARVENEKAHEQATRDFLTVGMSSRFVESQPTATTAAS